MTAVKLLLGMLAAAGVVQASEPCATSLRMENVVAALGKGVRAQPVFANGGIRGWRLYGTSDSVLLTQNDIPSGTLITHVCGQTASEIQANRGAACCNVDTARGYEVKFQMAGGEKTVLVSTYVSAKPRGSMSLTNEKVRNRDFLKAMYGDDYFPKHLVGKGKQILIRLCERIEKEKPADLQALYKLTHGATEEFNALAEEFSDAGSEIETVARENIGEELYFIAQAYGFTKADAEELMANREW
jgi:uncharacterized protein DUF5713